MNRKISRVKCVALVILSITLICVFCFGLLVVFVYKDINFEADERLFEGAKSFNSTCFYANGANSEDEYLPKQIECSGSMRKIFYPSDEISRYLKEGFVAVEDKIFYQHKGFDLKRTAMAAINYITKKQKVFGASTITQQVVKNISGDDQPSIKRKIGEIIRAIHIERWYSKSDILEVYLNVVPMSENIYGVGAASRAYFGKEPSDLLPEEAATLIGITNATTAYNPYTNAASCLKKRNIVLSVMHNDGILNDEEYQKAVAKPLKVIPREKREDRFDSWFVELVIDEVTNDLAKKYDISNSAARMMLLGGGYSVYTTMNIKAQSILEEYFENPANFPAETSEGLNYSMVITDSHTGDIAAIVGRVGEKKGNRLLNHALIPHTPGSALKPIALYAPLIDEGKINWATVIDDVPKSFSKTNDGYKEYPHNSPDIYDGLTTVKDGIRLSKNTLAISLCNMRGEKNIFNSLLNDFNFETLVGKDGSLTDIATAPMALGQLTRGVSLLRLTEAYSVFPGEGKHSSARSYLYVRDHRGIEVLKKEKEEKRIYKPSTAKIMTQMLMTVTESGTADRISLKNKIQTAGKTGTSGGSRDKIFVGYTPYYTAGIWCGYDDGRAVLGVSKGHLEIWDQVMTMIHEDHIRKNDQEEFSTDGLVYMPYCKDSGGKYSEICIYDPRGTRREYGYFTEDNYPVAECSRHVLCKYDSETKAIACEKCPAENIVVVSLIKADDREFPKEIYITDAEYVYRDVSAYTKRPIDFALPYFQNEIPPDIFVGKSRSKKQFNSNCYIHDD